jgi:Tfp pilus assembly protein PilN
VKTHFNLASSPLENNRRFIAGAATLGIIAVAALLFLSVHAVRARRTNGAIRADISRLEDQIQASQREQERLRVALKNPRILEVMNRAQFLNNLIEQRTFPWTKMFADLEQILPPGVRVVSISPQMDKTGRVKVMLVVSAVNDEQKMKFVRSMVSSPAFSNVRPTQESHPEKVSTGNTGAVLLSLEAQYATI